MKRRMFSLLLVLCMVLGMLPTAASAAGTSQENAVTVYFTVEGNGNSRFTFANADGKAMAVQKLTVPYFDLALYGRQDLYYNPDCYAGAGQVSQKPGTAETAEGVVTILHLFIYATEVFRCKVEPEDAGKGYLANNNKWSDFGVYTQQAGSAFVNFWDYSNNITYYLNYEYPLGKVGWGSTCDQIPLKDGDIVTVRYDKGTEGYGTYHHFGEKGLIAKEITKGNQLNLTLFKTTKTADYSGTGHEPVGAGHTVSVVSEIGGTVLAEAQTNEYGDVRLDTSKLPKGRYYVTSTTYGPAVMLLLIGEHEYLPKVTAPTCTEGGYTTYTCSGCGKGYKDNQVPATGHNYIDGVCACGAKEDDVSNVIPGDMNGDNKITSSDVTNAVRAWANEAVLTDQQKAAGDKNGNGKISSSEVSTIIRIFAEA